MRGVTREQIGEAAGLSSVSVNKVFLGLPDIKLTTLQQCAAALGLRVEIQFVETMDAGQRVQAGDDCPLTSK